MTEILLPVHPRDLSPKARLARFQTELAERSDGTARDRARLVLKYLDPDAPAQVGSVALSDGRAARRMHWRHSTTALTKPGEATELRSGAWRGPAFDIPPPARRAPLARVEAMVRRYAVECRRGNQALVAGLLADCQAEYWKAGMPVRAEDLRALAAKCLTEAEKKQKADWFKRSTRPDWVGK